MNQCLSEAQFDLFRSLLLEKTGLNFENDKLNFIYKRICERMAACQFNDPTSYYKYITTNPVGQQKEFVALIGALVVGETYMFREPDQFWALQSDVFPQLAHAAGGSRRKTLKFWCAGCSTGEEAYSISIAATKCSAFKDKEIDFFLLGTELNANAIAVARSWSLSTNRLDRMPEEFKSNVAMSLESSKGIRSLKPEYRKNVKFIYHNLVDDDFYQNQDLIFCRNVLLYFVPEVRQKLINKFYDSLNEGGFLFTAKTDAPPEFYSRFKRCEFKNAIYYRKV